MTKPWVDNRSTICIDYNGCLDLYKGYKIGMYPPRPGVKEFLEKLVQVGYKIVILTAADTKDVWRFLKTNGLDKFVADVTNEKVPAIAYIDDRAVRFDGDFEATYYEILHFRPFWEKESDNNGLG